MEKELQAMALQLRTSHEENRSLRQLLKKIHEDREGEAGFQTPDEEKKTDGAARDRPGARAKTASTPQGRGVGSTRPEAQPDKMMDFMMIMLQSMQELQKGFLQKESKSSPEVEVMRNGVADFPILGD